MERIALAWYARHQQRIEWGFFAVFLALFAYSLLDALALLPGEPGFKPWLAVSLNGALLIQSVGQLVQRRFAWASIALMVLSMVVLVGGFAIAR